MLSVLRDAYRLRNRHAFTPHALRAVTSVIPADIATCFTIDSRTCEFTSAATPVGADDFRGASEAFRRHVSDHPMFVNRMRVRDGRAHKISDFLTRRELHRLPLYDAYYRHIGTEFQMAVALPGPKEAIVGIALSRHRRDCSERERALLNILSPHLRQAYVSAGRLSRLEARIGRVQEAAGAGDQELVVLPEGRSTWMATPRGRRWLATYFDGDTGPTHRLPDALRRWIDDQASGLLIADDVPSARRPLVVARDDRELEVHIAWHGDETILLLRERVTRIRAEALVGLGLSRRETEVLAWVAEGRSNAEIGTILGTSGRTVGKHLERIYQRLGVETRTAAAARAIAHASGSAATP